jgi:hypothetical protein
MMPSASRVTKLYQGIGRADTSSRHGMASHRKWLDEAELPETQTSSNPFEVRATDG